MYLTVAVNIFAELKVKQANVQHKGLQRRATCLILMFFS